MSRNIGHKYNAVRCEADSIKFASKLEKRYYEKLKLMVADEKLVMFLRQPRFDLGGGVTYAADFLEFHTDGSCRVVDCKGMFTKEFIAKKKIVEDLYPIEVHIVTKV